MVFAQLWSMRERTFAIIKPDAVEAKKEGKIIDALLAEGFDIIEMRMLHLDQGAAEQLYIKHVAKPYFASLMEFITSGPIIALQVEREDAVAHLRVFVGSTNPRRAASGTLRRRFGTSTLRNAIHASDSPGNAAMEAAQFFAQRTKK